MEFKIEKDHRSYKISPEALPDSHSMSFLASGTVRQLRGVHLELFKRENETINRVDFNIFSHFGDDIEPVRMDLSELRELITDLNNIEQAWKNVLELNPEYKV